MIVLATLNAKYIHASLGLRYLLANMGNLRAQTELCEYIIGQRPADIVEDIISRHPRIVGFGVYIWNVEETTKVIALLKEIAPAIHIVIGGPEVSYETDVQPIAALADHVITGWGELSFPRLCQALLEGDDSQPRHIAGEQPPLAQVQLPYEYYSDEDIRQRLIYVEASRGCPYKCEFCLSALDRTAWPFDIELFIVAMQELYARGARHFKFVDRTFNLSARTSLRILEFFLERLDERLFLHFELIPDHLPEALKNAIACFPAGSLQFEIGIQTFNSEVQSRISRKQDNVQAQANLHWLRRHTQAHIHCDLIAGLPGEDLHSFARGFDRLIALEPHEIQVGILKRLRGTPIIRHTPSHAMRYNPAPPYNVLATDCIDFQTMQQLSRFARYWDLVGNSGRFTHARPILLGDAPFAGFMQFSDWLYSTTRQTHQIALERLFDLLAEYFSLHERNRSEALTALARDYSANGLRGHPDFMQHASGKALESERAPQASNTSRQRRHHRN
ncbi:MAG: DUF4080 domain-containing protein [Gammaproteobacteria bacterium]